MISNHSLNRPAKSSKSFFISNYFEILHSGKIEVLEQNKIWNRIHFNTQTAITKITNTKAALKTRSMPEDIQTQEVSCPGGVSILASEPALNEHVLSHLLSNAIKYSNRGQKIKISVECKNELV